MSDLRDALPRPPEILVISHLFPTKKNLAMGNFVDQLCLALARDRKARPIVLSIVPTRMPLNPISGLKLLVKGFILARSETGISPNGVPVIVGESPYIPGFGIFNSFIHACVLLRIHQRIAGSLRTDIVHAHTHLYDGFAACLLSRRIRKPLIVTEHTGPFSSITNTWPKRRLVAAVAGHASRVVTVSESLRSTMLKLMPHLKPMMVVLPNALNTDIFKFQGELARDQPKRVGWLGHFDPVKRIDKLVVLFGALRAEDPTLKLRIIGPDKGRAGVELDLWRRDLHDAAEYASPETQREVAHELAKLNLLLVTSDVETFSMAALEGAASGVPVVSTDCGGPRDILFDAAIGRIGSSDAELIEHARAFLANDTGEARRLRSERVHGRFAADKTAARYLALYREVMTEFTSP